MINRSQKFIFYEFLSIIGHITEHPKDTASPCTDQKQFYYPFRLPLDRRLVERNKAVENESKQSIKAVFGQQRIKLSF